MNSAKRVPVVAVVAVITIETVVPFVNIVAIVTVVAVIAVVAIVPIVAVAAVAKKVVKAVVAIASWLLFPNIYYIINRLLQKGFFGIKDKEINRLFSLTLERATFFSDYKRLITDWDP